MGSQEEENGPSRREEFSQQHPWVRTAVQDGSKAEITIWASPELFWLLSPFSLDLPLPLLCLLCI